MRILIIGAGMRVYADAGGLLIASLIHAPVPPPRPIDILPLTIPFNNKTIANYDKEYRKPNQPFYRGLKKYSRKVK